MDYFYSFEIPSLNNEKLVNNLIKKYHIYDIKKNAESFKFKCKIKDKQKIQKYLIKSNIIIKAQSLTTLPKHIYSLKRLGLLAGMIVGLLFWLITSFFVSDVIIMGNNAVSNNEIYLALKECGVRSWMLKSEVNTELIRNKLSENSNISEISVVIKGNKIIINIKEKLKNNEYINLGNFQPIVSCYNGKITSLNIVQGTAAKKVGDIVKLGDILVFPYITDSNNSVMSVQPIADIVCDVWIEAQVDVFENETKYVRTEKFIKNTELYIFGLLLYSSEKKCDFEKFETVTSFSNMTNIILPLKTKTTYFYELEKKVIKIDFENNKQRFVDKCRQMALLNVKSYDIIKEESHSITANDGKYTITYVITVSKKII